MAAQRRKHGRRYRRGRFSFLYVLLSVLLIIAAVLAGSFVFFRVDTVTVEGNRRYSDEEVFAATRVELGDNLFRIPTGQVADRIHAALPYVHQITIQRALPSELIVTVTESEPAAAIQGDDGWFLLDARGKVVERGGATLKLQAAVLSGLTPITPAVGEKLAVEEEQQTKLESLTQLLGALESRDMLGGLEEIDLTASNLIRLAYLERFTVELPLSCDFPYKVQTLEYVVNTLEENETGLIDLTRGDKTHFIPS